MLNQAFAFPVRCEWAEGSSVGASLSRLLAAKTFQTLQVPQSVSALKTIAFVLTAYLRDVITKKTLFRMGPIRHSRAGRRGLARVTERFESERIVSVIPSVSADFAEPRV